MTDQAATTREGLLRMSQARLDALYRGLPGPGPVPTGDTKGTVLVLPGTPFSGPLRVIARLLVWQGKVFRPDQGDLTNKTTPLQVQSIRAEVYGGTSWIDGAESTIIDYSRTSFVARWIRDEIRQVGPHLWLGKVFIRKWHAIDFLLED